MVKKTTIYIASFLILLLINFFLLAKLTTKLDRETSIKRVLAEIEEENSLAKQFNYSNAPFVYGRLETETKLTDGRPANLKAFFRKHNRSEEHTSELQS